MKELALHNIKGKLARSRDTVTINISQISYIRVFDYINHSPPERTVITMVSENAFYLATETYLSLLHRIEAVRDKQGPNALIEIIVQTSKSNDNSRT